MSRFRSLSFLLWLVALLLGGWTLAQLPLAAISASIAALTWPQWLAWTGLNILIVLLLTQRWQVLTKLLDLRVGFGRLLLIRQAGQAVSFITPGPQFGGEPLQIYWLYKYSALPLHKAVLSLGLDRFFELWVNFSLLLLGVFCLLLSSGLTVAAGLQIAVLLVALLLALSLLGWILLRQPQWLSSRMERLARHWQQHPRLRRIESHWQALGNDLRQAIRSGKPALLKAFMLSLLGWAGLLGELALMLGFLDLRLDLPAFILIIVAMRLALLLPLPGGIGTLEASVLWSFQILQLPATAAVGLIALMRLRDAVVLVAGLLCLRAAHAREQDSPCTDSGADSA